MPFGLIVGVQGKRLRHSNRAGLHERDARKVTPLRRRVGASSDARPCFG